MGQPVPPSQTNGNPLTSLSTQPSSPSPRVPKPGVYCPAVTFFEPQTDQLALVAQRQYYAYLSRSGLTGLVILGTNAETLLLTREERKTLLQLAREAVPEGYPIIAGVSGHSTAQVREYISDAHDAGADFALVLPAAYFGKQTTPSVIKAFFSDIAKFSPLPIVLYNFPAVCNGVDLDSEIITVLANEHPNIVGVKLTCGSVGKISRLSATFSPDRFATFGGQSDFLVGGLAAGSAGCIAAFANVFPKTIVQIYELYQAGQYEKALKLQQQAALAEGFCKSGIASVKYAASLFSARQAGIKADEAELLLRPRRPYEPPSQQVKSTIEQALAGVAEVESTI